jgi:hypothetical protein
MPLVSADERVDASAASDGIGDSVGGRFAGAERSSSGVDEAAYLGEDALPLPGDEVERSALTCGEQLDRRHELRGVVSAS